jgi:hypothetical protein
MQENENAEKLEGDPKKDTGGIMTAANDFFQDQDVFGQPVEISYQGKSSYTTTFGGICSVIFKGFMLTYVINQIMIMWSKSEWDLS